MQPLKAFPSIALTKSERHFTFVFIEGLLKKLLPIIALTLSIGGLLIAIDVSFEHAAIIKEQKKTLGYAYQGINKSFQELSSLLLSTGQRLMANLAYEQKRRILEDSLHSTDPFISQGTLYWVTTKPKFHALSHYGFMEDLLLKSHYPFLKELAHLSQTMVITVHENSFYCARAFSEHQGPPCHYLLFRLPYEVFLKLLQERYRSIRVLREREATNLHIPRSNYGLLDAPYEYEGLQFNAFIRVPGLLFLLADSHGFNWKTFLKRNYHHFGFLLLLGFLASLYAASKYHRGYAHVKGKLQPIIKTLKAKEVHYIQHIATLEHENKALMRRQNSEEQAYHAEKAFIALWSERRQDILQEVAEKLGEVAQEMRAHTTSLLSEKMFSLLLKAMVDISTLATGSLNNDKIVPTALGAIVDRALNILMRETEAFAHEIHQHIPPNLPPIMMDEAFCLLLITNLFYYAIERTPRKGTISITIEDMHEQAAIKIIIEDTGFRSTLASRAHNIDRLVFLPLNWQTLEVMAHCLQARLTDTYQGRKGNRIELVLPLSINEDPYKAYDNVIRLF